MQKFLSYFSFQGRANRQRYWMTTLAIVGLVILVGLVSAGLSIIPLLGLVVLPLWLALSVAGLANGARRLHDRGKSAWWLLLFLGVPTLFSIPGELMKSGGTPDAQGAGAVIALLGLPFSIWGFVVMGCLKGTSGPNRFGDDPLQSTQEVFA